MFMAHNAMKTSVGHDLVHGEYVSILKMNVMMKFLCLFMTPYIEGMQAY
jgi:fatty acid desaturase